MKLDQRERLHRYTLTAMSEFGNPIADFKAIPSQRQITESSQIGDTQFVR
jgi:hypothetical protein